MSDPSIMLRCKAGVWYWIVFDDEDNASLLGHDRDYLTAAIQAKAAYLACDEVDR